MPRARDTDSIGRPAYETQCHGRVAGQELGDRPGIGDVPLHPQRQRLDPGQDVERVRRRQGRTEVAQRDRPGLHREPEVAERLDEVEAVVGRDPGRRGTGTCRSPPSRTGPTRRRRRPSTCRGRTGTWSASGRRGRRPTRTAGTGTASPACCRRRAGSTRRARRRPAPRGRRRRRPGWRATRRRPPWSARRSRAATRRGSVASTNVERPAEPRERVAELGQRAAVQLARGDDVVAGLQQRVEREELGGVARRRGDRRPTALQGGDPLLERGDGRVRQPRVDVAEGLEVEQRGRVVDVVEDVRRGLVDRHVARAGDRVRAGAGVDGPRREAVRLVDLDRAAASAGSAGVTARRRRSSRAAARAGSR